VGLVDTLDALTTARPYKEAWTLDDALAYLEEQKGRYFDPQLVDLFVAERSEIEAIFFAHG
jgi:response regulator RpfG family c-di-GMP phosphodiesterase